MRIAVIDDFLEEREQLAIYINEYFSKNPIYRQIDLFESGEEFMSKWESGAYDLIFIDIYLNGINGIEIAENIRKTDTECLIIFATSSSDFAVKGFELRAADYLVKPFSYEKFKTTMDYCSKALHRHDAFIKVKESRTMIKIRLDDILFTDYFNHYIQIHTTSRIVKCYLKFEDFSPTLLCYPQFLGCYRNCIINMDKVISLKMNDFILTDGERVPITRKNRQEIHQYYVDYQFLKLDGKI